MIQKFDYDDINLIPKKCTVKSRSECDTTVQLGKHSFKIPVVPANMSSVMNKELAETLASNGYFYIMHRFISSSNIINFVVNMSNKNLITSISVGIKQEHYFLIDTLCDKQLHPDYITIDVAHGHADTVKNMITHIKNRLPNTFIIAGNVCTTQAVVDLQSYGADAIKVGIGPGSSCTTAMATGFGSRNCQASTVLECVERAKVPIIADGGVVHPADIAKALVLGATMVMTGVLFSGCMDTPGELITIDGKLYKEYWGSASEHESGKTNRIEGTKKLTEYKNKTVLEQINYLIECLQSSISYGGGNNLQSLNYVQWQ